ncbi:MAG: hypothetical protein WC485_08255, partial [Opitutaceae bacterium]
LSFSGWWLGRYDRYPHFTRFFPAISPEVSYYPTVAEMCAIVRARCRPGQVLVIVGGNSIFYGSGQPAELLWTRRLQELLGDRYCVVNLAFRGASASDGAAVVAEVLRREFPRQIYVANVGTLQAINPMGSIPYRFIFWEAYYKGELAPYAPRDQIVHAYFWDDRRHRSEWLDTAGRVWLDRALHFRDFWNAVARDWFFTVPTAYYPTLAEGLRARASFSDREGNFDDTPFPLRFRADTLKLEMNITRGFTGPHYERTTDGQWKMRGPENKEFNWFIRVAMPEALRRRTLIVVSKNSPFYVDRLSADERARDEQSYGDSLAIWRAAGYHATTYTDNFTASDYGDRAHLTVSGGRKLAALVADNIRPMAVELGYLSP